MTVFQDSYLYSLLTAFWSWFTARWEESRLSDLCDRFGAWVRTAAEASRLCRFAAREGTLPRAWPESWSCRLFAGLLDLPCAAARWLYRRASSLWEGSAILRSLSGEGPAVLLGCAMLIMLVAPHDYWNNAYAFFIAVALAALFVLGCAARPDRRLEGTAFGPYVFLYLLCVCSALATSLSTSLSVRFFLFHAASFLLATLTVSAVTRYEQVQTAVAVTVAGVTVAALYGCYQGYVGVEVVASLQDMVLNKGMPGRVYSFFDNPNNFAELLEMLIPLNLALVFNCRGRCRLAALCALVPSIAAIGLTYSRSSWIGLALALLVFIALTNWRLVPILLGLGVLGLPFLPKTIYNRILTIGNMKDSSTLYRFAIYDSTGDLMKDYWLRGVGLGTDALKKAFSAYPTMYDGNHPIHTHNNYLEMWVETGLLGFLAYVGLVFHAIKSGVKEYYRTTDPRVRRLLGASVGAFCGISVVGIAEYTWFYPRNMFVYWFLFGVIAACIKLSRQGGGSAS